MQLRTFELLGRKKGIGLVGHLDGMEPKAAIKEMADIVRHLERIHSTPAGRKEAVDSTVWDQMLNQLTATQLPYNPTRTRYALRVVESALNHRGECILELIPPLIEKIHKTQTDPSPTTHARIIGILDRLSNQGLANTETHDNAKALKIHLEHAHPGV